MLLEFNLHEGGATPQPRLAVLKVPGDGRNRFVGDTIQAVDSTFTLTASSPT